MQGQRVFVRAGVFALVILSGGCGGGTTDEPSPFSSAEFQKAAPGIHGGGHIGKTPNAAQMVTICNAIDILWRMGLQPNLRRTQRGAKYRKAARVLHQMKVTGRLAYECGAGYVPALAWCMRDRRASKRGDRINVTARGLRKSPASLAGVLFHEYIHACQGYSNGFPRSPQGRNGYRIELCAYWRQYCFLRDAQAAGHDVSDSINMWRGHYGGQYDFPSLYDADPLTYPDRRNACWRCDRRRRGGRVWRFGALSIDTSFSFDASESQPTIRQMRFDVGTEQEIASGLDRVDNILAYQPSARGIVLLVAGEQGSGYAIRRFVDTDGDGNVDASSGATVVGRGVGLGSIGGLAWIPNVAGDSVFALDVDNHVIYRLNDQSGDGLPDTLGAVYANAEVFPALEDAASLSVHGEYGVTPLVLAAYMQPWSVVTCGYWSGLTYMELSDNDGDGAAGTATDVLSQDEEVRLRPVVTNSVHVGQMTLEVHGSIGCTFDVRAFEAATGSYSDILGSSVSNEAGFATIALNRPLVGSDVIAVFDATNEQGVENMTVSADPEAMVFDASETMGSPSGGTTITLTGESLPTNASATVWFDETEGVVVSRSAASWVVRSPAYVLPEGRIAVASVEIRQHGEDPIDASHFAYVPYRMNGIVSGVVYMDTNEDGIRDDGEFGIPGVELELVDFGDDGEQGTADDEVVATLKTRANGTYMFSEYLPPASYVVRVAPALLPSGVAIGSGGGEAVVIVDDGSVVSGVNFACR